jgi:hypothetical protein
MSKPDAVRADPLDHLAADLPPANSASDLEVLRSDAPIFADYLHALRSRTAAWFVEPTDRLEICNAKIPVRLQP